MRTLSIGEKVVINTSSCSTQPDGIGKNIVGKKATVIWTKNFKNPDMMGICVLLDEYHLLASAWSYFTGAEFIKLSDFQ